MNNYVIKYSDDYLAHHGILGQKWGVRRFQNPDGTWTEAGKKRYGDDAPDGSHNAPRKTKKESLTSTISKGFSKDENKHLTDEERARLKKVAVGAGIAAGVLAAGFAAYKINSLAGMNKDYVIKGNSIVQRISPDTKLHNEFFVAAGRHDKMRYQNLLGEHFKRNGYNASDIKVHKMKVGSDMKIASRKSAKEVFENLQKTDSDFNKLTRFMNYDQFNQALVGQNHSNPEIQKFYSALKQKGYAGLLDMNDKKYSGYNAKKATIIIDAKNIVSDTVKNYNSKPSLKAIDNGKRIFEQVAEYNPKTIATYAGGSAALSGASAAALAKDSKKQK